MSRGKQGTKAGHRERNLSFQRMLRERKRLRRQRREEQETSRSWLDVPVMAPNESPVRSHVEGLPHPQTIGDVIYTPPFRAPDVKDDDGWQILDAAGQLADHATSRDKARGEAKMRNKGVWS